MTHKYEEVTADDLREGDAILMTVGATVLPNSPNRPGVPLAFSGSDGGGYRIDTGAMSAMKILRRLPPLEIGDWVSGSAATHPSIYRVQAVYGDGTRLVIAHRDGVEEMVAALPFNRTDWRWWFGGVCPVDPLAQVEIQTSDSPGATLTGRANSLRWSAPTDKPPGNITAYRQL